MAVVDLEVRGSIALITMNRPEQLNAMDAEMAVRLIDTFEEVRRSEDIRVVILTGAGEKAFSAGGDLDAVIPLMTGARPPETEWEKRWLEIRKFGGPFKTDVGKPVIAAVNGHAVAGGMEMVLNTDIRICVPNATFGIPEVKVGLFPGGGSTVRLRDQIPFAHAMHALLTGDSFSAEDALRYGMVNAIVSADSLMEEAMKIAEKIAANAPLAVQAIRSSFRDCTGVPEQQALAIESEYSARVHATEDAIEGPKAFLEKRKPVYRGR
ncbi:MAG: enoyl-CoA hydratase-related protein [Henriciella sp.]|uniref:enoyl-CoA hydratase/isomerase family protein n=1 Tax=Henriciella sp. TaxID=1968823 RepID=UPI003C70B4F4